MCTGLHQSLLLFSDQLGQIVDCTIWGKYLYEKYLTAEFKGMLYCLVLSSVQNKTVSNIWVRSCANLILVHNLIKKSGMCNSVILNWSLCICWIIWGKKNHPLTDPVTGGLTLFHKLEWCGPAWSGCVGAKVPEQTINCPENIPGVNILPVDLIEAVLLNPFEPARTKVLPPSTSCWRWFCLYNVQ